MARRRRSPLLLALALALTLGACGADSGANLDMAALLEEAATSTVPGDAGRSANNDAADRPPASGEAQGDTRRDQASRRDAGPAQLRTDVANASEDRQLEPGASPVEPVRVGIHFSEDLQAAYSALGASGAEPDVDVSVRAITNHLNRTGGLAGRPIEPYFHGSDPLDGTFDAQSQAACEDFAEQRVAVVMSGAVMPSIVLPDCLSKRQIPMVWNYHYLVDEVAWAQYRPYLYMPFSINADRLGSVYVNGLDTGGYFNDAKVGIVRYDNPQHNRFSKVSLRPALAAIRADVVEEVAVSQPPSAAAAGDTATQISAAILRLRNAGATHVLFVPTGGAVPFIFMTEAENQGYRPRYGLSTLDIPYFVNDQASAEQLNRALAVGWSPASDVYREDEPPSAPRQLCYQLTNSRTAQRYCDGLFFLQAALAGAPTIDADHLRVGAERLGDSFDPVFSLKTRFGPGRHDGAGAIRLVAFNNECECFRYAGPVQEIG